MAAETEPGEVAIRIDFVTRKWPPAVGGMETYSLRLAELLAARAPLRVISLPGRADGAPPGAAALLRFGVGTAARLALRRRPADVVHLGDMAIWPLGLAARLRSGRTKVVLSAHGTDVSYAFRGGLKGRLYGAYLGLGARLMPAARIIANSAATAEAARAHGFRVRAVVPLAGDLVRPGPVPPPAPWLLFAGRLVERKGLSWFVREVLPQLPTGLGLKVAGTVWSETEAQSLTAPNVEHLGPLDRDALAEAYAEALAVVVPNIDVANREFEGFGLVAPEAAACGGVVVAAAHSGLREAVIDGVTGIQLPPGDAEAWVRTLTEIRGWSPARRAEFVARSRETARSHFSWERVADDTLRAYSAMADVPPA